jgi:hypothetical protein
MTVTRIWQQRALRCSSTATGNASGSHHDYLATREQKAIPEVGNLMWQVLVTAIGSLVVIAGIVILFYTIHRKKDETHATIKILNIEISGGDATVTMIVGSTESDSPQPEVVRITSPADGQKVVGLDGVLVEETADKAHDRRLWMFDHADNDQYYVVNSSPLAVIDGHWSFFDRQVGSATADDDGHTFVLMVVTADDSCQEELQRKKPNNEGDIAFSSLPTGCTPGPAVNVVKVAHS